MRKVVTMRKVWDCFLFCHELDLLEARLGELDSAVYRHVLVEAPVTFQGNPKPLYYAENKERFAPWQDKIVHVVADLPDGTAWDREHASQEAIWQGLDDLGDDDIFLMSDVDEIPRANVLQLAPGHVLPMRNHLLAVNLVDVGWWPGAIAIIGRPPGTMQEFRERRLHSQMPILRNPMDWAVDSGWHFSWLGGPSELQAKSHAFSHGEVAEVFDDYAERIYREKIHPASGASYLLEAVIDGSWPKYMQDRKGPASWYWPGDQ